MIRAKQLEALSETSHTSRRVLVYSAVVLWTILLVACSGSSGGSRYDHAEPVDGASFDSDEPAETVGLSIHEEYGADSDGSSADASRVDAYDVEDGGNYICTQDCSGHEAGFVWAQENDLSDNSDCRGNSQSFVEGCEAFVDDRQKMADETAQAEAEQVAEAAASADEPDWDED